IATYSQAHGLRLIGSFQRKARFIRAALNTSAIALQNLTFEDVSCYRCIFNLQGNKNITMLCVIAHCLAAVQIGTGMCSCSSATCLKESDPTRDLF
uniref:Uncharacterized protein n=1 Tax=Meleagris gallopavo TaxID=9103 RepID=A0A803Y9C4_MELGA